MNSKLYQKYLSLKIENPELTYLFKSKNHCFFIADDATNMASLLNLDLTSLGSVIMKCEFPIYSSEAYFNKFKKLKINIKVVPLTEDVFNYDLENCLNSSKYNELILNFLKVNIDDLSIFQAYELLKDMQKKFRNFKIK